MIGRVSTVRAGSGFLHGFYLVSPPLDNYSYQLFEVDHAIQLYPLEIRVGGTDAVYRCATPEELNERLREIFAADKTKNIIKAILAQVPAA